MRRFLPALIVVIGLAALAIDFLPLGRPFSQTPQQIETRLGLDLQGGLRGEYRAVGTTTSPITRDSLADIRTIIENRINQYGVAEPIVQTQGSDRIVVEIPGITNEAEVRRLIGSTGRLEFQEVPPERAAEVVSGQRVPFGFRVIFGGDQIKSAAPGTNQAGQRAVDIRLQDEGARLFDQHAAQHYGEQFAIVLDDIVISAPSINARQFGGQAQISGGFTSQAEVNQLVTVLRYGALPNAIEEVSFSKIS